MSGAVEKGLGVIIGRATGKDDSARMDTSLSRAENWDAYADKSSGRARSTDVGATCSLSNLPGVHDPCDHQGRVG